MRAQQTSTERSARPRFARATSRRLAIRAADRAADRAAAPARRRPPSSRGLAVLSLAALLLVACLPAATLLARPASAGAGELAPPTAGVSSAAPLRAASGGDRWLAVGPAGAGTAVALAADPQDPDRLYLATAAGVFASRDGGAGWQMSSLPGVVALAVHPASPRRLFAVTQTVPSRLRLWRSDDRGRTWTPRAQIAGGGDDPRSFDLAALAVDPGDPDTLYLAATARRHPPPLPEGGTTAAAGAAKLGTDRLAEPRLWRSRDGGDTLVARSAPTLAATASHGLLQPDVADLLVDRDGVLFAATRGGVLRSDDGGGTWRSASDGLGSRRDRTPAVRRLAALPGVPGLLYAATDPDGDGVLYTSADGGAHWTATGLGVPAGEVLDLEVDPHDRRSVYVSIEGAGVYATRGGAWEALLPGLPEDAAPHRLALAATLPRTLFAATRAGDVFRRSPPPPACVDDGHALCLEDRFRVDVDWWVPPDDPLAAAGVAPPDLAIAAGRPAGVSHGIGHAVPLTRDGGWFWFFDPEGPEVAVKVLAGEPVDGRWWVSYSSLSDVGLDLRVFDVVSGRFEVYRQPPGELASVAHVAGFPAGEEARPAADGLWFAALPEGGCRGDSIDLCLWDGRFEVEVDWRSLGGEEGAAVADRLSPRAGWFRFRRPGDPELFVKIEDGRAANGHWWVFFGSLSDLGFTLRVRDRESGESVLYQVDPGERASHGDTEAFADDAEGSQGKAREGIAAPESGLFDSAAPDG